MYYIYRLLCYCMLTCNLYSPFPIVIPSPSSSAMPTNPNGSNGIMISRQVGLKASCLKTILIVVAIIAGATAGTVLLLAAAAALTALLFLLIHKKKRKKKITPNGILFMVQSVHE